jgi:hypothetical protein
MYDETDRFHLSYAEAVYATVGLIKWNLNNASTVSNRTGHLGPSFALTEAYCFPAASGSVLGSSFPSHPLSYVWRAKHNLHSVGLTLSQEPNHVHIHDRYFLQVQNKQRSVVLELLFQFSDVLRLKVTNQTNRGLPTL